MSQNHSHGNLSLLDDSLLGIRLSDRFELVSLPEVLARLSMGRAFEFTALQAHQLPAWHSFLVQTAATALHRASLVELPVDAVEWRRLLVQAAKADGAGPEAFQLIVEDLSAPAFLQPPIPEGSFAPLKNEHFLPSEELDVLITSKNHDVKINRIENPEPQHWVYALVALQTMQGFLGAGNYGISRMNGGFASRPTVAFAASPLHSSRFQRDVKALLDTRVALSELGFAPGREGKSFLWCLPWDGTTSLSFSQLDPFFIEICRRVRLTRLDGRILAHRGSSKVARVDSGERLGDTGDAWTPVSRKDNKALTISETGFHYERIQDLLFGDWRSGAAGKWTNSDLFWVGQALVRGQGKTGGFHERWLPLSLRARSLFSSPSERERVGQLAVAWVNLAKETRLRILKPAILSLFQGGPEALKFDDKRAEPFLDDYDSYVDSRFFHDLIEQSSSSTENALTAFASEIRKIARTVFEKAVRSAPIPLARRHRAIAFGKRALEGGFRNNSLFPPESAAQTSFERKQK